MCAYIHGLKGTEVYVCIILCYKAPINELKLLMDKGDNPLTPEDFAALLEDLEALLGRCLPDPWLTMSNSRSSFSAHTRSQVTPRRSLSIH